MLRLRACAVTSSDSRTRLRNTRDSSYCAARVIALRNARAVQRQVAAAAIPAMAAPAPCSASGAGTRTVVRDPSNDDALVDEQAPSSSSRHGVLLHGDVRHPSCTRRSSCSRMHCSARFMGATSVFGERQGAASEGGAEGRPGGCQEPYSARRSYGQGAGLDAEVLANVSHAGAEQRAASERPCRVTTAGDQRRCRRPYLAQKMVRGRADDSSRRGR